MKLSKSLLVIPAASFLLAAAIGSGACSSSVSITIPTGGEGTVPSGVVFPDGYIVGDSCDGTVYVQATTGTGWLACDDGTWEYYDSDAEFAADGYTEDTDATGPDSGDDTSGDDTSGDDTSGGSGDDTSGDDTSGDDTSGGSGDDTSGGDDTSSGGDDTSSGGGDDTSSSS